MGTAATAKQMRSLQEESLIPRAIKLLFDTLATMKQEYSVILKVWKVLQSVCDQWLDFSLKPCAVQSVLSSRSAVL